jgi:hypothetical protein
MKKIWLLLLLLIPLFLFTTCSHNLATMHVVNNTTSNTYTQIYMWDVNNSSPGSFGSNRLTGSLGPSNSIDISSIPPGTYAIWMGTVSDTVPTTVVGDTARFGGHTFSGGSYDTCTVDDTGTGIDF